jgi:hypothetical protein
MVKPVKSSRALAPLLALPFALLGCASEEPPPEERPADARASLATSAVDPPEFSRPRGKLLPEEANAAER